MSVEIVTRITEDGTEIDVMGSRDVAVVVRSELGERVYLPPSEFDGPVETSPYGGSSYATSAGIDGEESPYREAPENTRGVVTTPRGFRIRHEAPITEMNVHREAE